MIKMIKKIKIMTLNSIEVIIIVTRECKKFALKIQMIKSKNKLHWGFKKVNFIDKIREQVLPIFRKVMMKIIKKFDKWSKNFKL